MYVIGWSRRCSGSITQTSSGFVSRKVISVATVNPCCSLLILLRPGYRLLFDTAGNVATRSNLNNLVNAVLRKISAATSISSTVFSISCVTMMSSTASRNSPIPHQTGDQKAAPAGNSRSLSRLSSKYFFEYSPSLRPSRRERPHPMMEQASSSSEPSVSIARASAASSPSLSSGECRKPAPPNHQFQDDGSAPVFPLLSSKQAPFQEKLYTRPTFMGRRPRYGNGGAICRRRHMVNTQQRGVFRILTSD